MRDFIVCFDIDETLIHSTELRESSRQDALGPFWTYKRPGLDNLLAHVNSFAKIGIYTAASQKYAENVINQYMAGYEIQFLLSSKNCVQQLWRTDIYGRGYEGYIKDLKKVVQHRQDLDRLVAVDDKPFLYPRQYGNVIGVNAYEGAVSDDVLPKLAKYLEHLSAFPNVRKIEKRNWMSKYNSDYNMR